MRLIKSSLFMAGARELTGKVDLKTKGTVLVGLGRVNSMSRALRTVGVTRGTNCATVDSRHSKRATSAAVTSLTITLGAYRVGANTPSHSRHITGCGRLLEVRRRLKGDTICPKVGTFGIRR